VAQLNLYVPDDLATRLRREARKAGLPLSRYVLSILSHGAVTAWPAGYFTKTCGFLREDLREPEDLPPEPVGFSEAGR
jgi:hypothetical protein